MKFRTKSTVNKKFIRIRDRISGGYGEPPKEVDVDLTCEWTVKPNSGTGKIDIETSSDGIVFTPYITHQLVDEDDCIEVDNRPSVSAPTYCHKPLG